MSFASSRNGIDMHNTRLRAISRLSNIPGLGSIRAAALYDAGVRNKAQLRKKEVFESLPIETQYHLTYPISRNVHHSVITKLTTLLPKYLTLVGSGRRGVEYSRDIDFLTTVKLDTVGNKLASLQSIKVIGQLNRGERRRSWIISMGKHIIKIDVFTTTKANYPFALLHFTGSKDFTIRVRAQAKRLGYKLSQYGLFDANGRRISGLKSERAILKKINITYKQPSER